MGNFDATIACEGRAVVLSANQCVRRKNLPNWITGKEEEAIGEEEASYKPNVSQDGETGKRASIVTRTEDNHEITWVAPDPNPSSKSASTGPQTTNGTSPIHYSKIPADDEAIQITDPVQTKAPHNFLALPASATLKPQFPAPMTQEESVDNDFVCRGGSCIISRTGSIFAGPLWEIEDGGLLTATVDFEDCERGRLDLDVAGSYGRNDSFELKVTGLDISPPP